MRSPLLYMLVVSSPAVAWDHVASESTTAPAAVTGLIAAPMGDRDVAILLGETQSWIVDPLHSEVVRTLDRGGSQAVLVDLNGDQRLDLVGCGDAGLWSVPWTGRYGGESTVLDERPCDAVIAVTEGALTGLVAAGEGWVDHYAEVEGEFIPSETAFEVLVGSPLLATHRGLVAYAVRGGEQMFERGPSGTSSFATGGAISDLEWSRRGWTWTLPESYAVADYTHQQTPLPDARILVPIDDDRLLVVGDGVSTWLYDDTVEAFSTPGGIRFAAKGDVDSDGCVDVLVADDATVTALTAVCAPEAVAAQDTADRPESDGPRLRTIDRARKRTVLGVEVPTFLGNETALGSERDRGQRYVVVGSGWAMGRTLGSVDVQIPFFPALALGYEFGGPNLRAFMGLDSAALFFWIRSDGGGGIHLVNATAGFTVGSPRLRIGPFATGGLLNYGGGVRTVLTPWIAGGAYKGIETRLTVFGPSTGEVMILYVWSQRLRKRSPVYDDEFDEPKPEVEPTYPELARITVRGEPKARVKVPVCGTFRVGAGAAVSASSTRYSWSFVGSDAPVSFGGSPAITMACESGGTGPGLTIGMETAPFLKYFGGPPQNVVSLNHYGTLTAGLDVGSPGFRLGVIGTAGIWELGGGVRSVIGLHTDRQGLRHHIELRAYALFQGAPAGEAMLLYGFSWDPWKKPAFRDD